MARKVTLIKQFILTGFFVVPASAALLFLLSFRNLRQVFFLAFILVHSFERVWETFYTTRERRAHELHGDWTLAIVTIAYILLCLLSIFEFFLFRSFIDDRIVVAGLFLYGLGFLFRRWGMQSLGKQWAIHAVGARKIKKVRLIKIGAYKYVRHPIYLGVMLEVLSIPLVANALFSLAFACFVNVPLQFVRLIIEEKNSGRRFGEKYEQYKKEVSMLVPYKHFRKHLKELAPSKHVAS